MSRSAVESGYAQALRSGVSGREIARGGRRPLDLAARPRPAAARAALPGLPAEPHGDPAEYPVGPAQADGGAWARDATVLLGAPPARGIRAHGQGTRARGRGRRAGRVGLAPRPPSDRAGARRVRPPGGDQVFLPAVRRARARRNRGAPAAPTRQGREAALGLADPLG